MQQSLLDADYPATEVSFPRLFTASVPLGNKEAKARALGRDRSAIYILPGYCEPIGAP